MADMDTRGAKRRHKRWPEALKREIVAATFEPSASVSIVARQYDVNANQVFSWRRRYREASEPSSTSSSTPGLLPVTVMPTPEDEPAAPPTWAASDTIEIEVSSTYRVRVGSSFDPRSLKRVLDVLRRR
jgi:transposase